MELKKYKLGDCLTMIENGAVIKQKKNAGGIPITRIETLSNDRFNRDRLGYADIFDESSYSHFILDDMDLIMSHINSRTFLGRTVIYRKHGDEKIIHGMNVLRLKTDIKVLNPLYAYYYFKTNGFRTAIDHIRKDAINQSSLATSDIKNLEILIPSIEEQSVIVSILDNLDRKIALNCAINQNLEALAKQFYDYWFVQFNFPNEEGKPYKSNGGTMTFCKELQIDIPQNWSVCRLSEFINKNNTGDWGADNPSDDSIEIGCIRGADIIKLNGLPRRYIKLKNKTKLLTEWDVVIEVSGGSPVQATGRSAFITPGVIKRNGGKITCSNFCHAFSFRDARESAYFFFMWRMFYDNDIMFNYEGKTSGIKNFMTETFLANKWVKAPTELIHKFFDIVKVIYSKIDTNIAENNGLIKQRDELLPLLMNGQVSINSDL